MALDFSSGAFAPRPGSTLGDQPKKKKRDLTPGTVSNVEQPGFELAFGFIPTVNVGNILGIENDVARIAANILLDPITLATTFLTGGLTAAGKVASASRALATSKIFLGASKGVTSAARVKSAQKAIKSIAAVESAAPEVKAILKTAVETKDTATFTKTLQKLLKTTKLDPAITKNLPTSKELFKLDDLMRAEDFFIKTGGTTNQMSNLLQAGALEEKLGQQVAKNLGTTMQQRDFLRFKVPFTGVQKTLVNGQPIWSTFGKYFNLSPLLTESAQKLAAANKIEAGDMRQFMFSLMDGRGALIEEAALAHSATKKLQVGVFTEALGEGKDVVQMSKLLTFFREGKGVSKATLQELGLADKFDKFRKGKNGFEFVTGSQLNSFLKGEGVLDQFASANKVVEESLDALRVTLNESGLVDDVPYITSYISHLWDITPTQAKKEAVSWGKKGFMENKRKFATFLAGMNKGYKLKYDDAFDIVEQYAIHVDRTMATRNVVQTLRSDKAKVLINNTPARLMESKQTLQKLGVLDQYTEITNPRVLQLLTKQGFKGNKPARRYVPDQMAKDLEIFFGDKWTSDVAKGLDNFNAVSKVMSLSFSMFHSMALTESAMAALGPVKGFKEAAKLGFGLPFMRNTLLKVGVGKGSVSKLDDGVHYAISNGLGISAPSDAPLQLYSQVMGNIGKTADRIMPGSSILTKSVDKAQNVMSTALWDNFHHPMKLMAFENRLTRAMKLQPNLTRDELAKDVADFVNDAFGGQNLKKLMFNPKMQQAMHWALLAPDWTISNLRIAGVGSTGVSGAVRGVLGNGRNAKEQLVGEYWRNALPVFFGSYALLNKALSDKWPWENAPGHEFDVSLGSKDAKGRDEYMKLGKQFREPFRWLIEPEKIFGAKLSPAIRTVVEQVTKHSTTGFPTEFADKQGAIPMTIVESVPKRLKSVVDKFIPFSLGGNSVMFAFPKSTFKEKDAIIALRSAIKGTKGSGASGKEVTDILRLAQANGLDLSRIKSTVRREVGDPRGLLTKGGL